MSAEVSLENDDDLASKVVANSHKTDGSTKVIACTIKPKNDSEVMAERASTNEIDYGRPKEDFTTKMSQNVHKVHMSKTSGGVVITGGSATPAQQSVTGTVNTSVTIPAKV